MAFRLAPPGSEGEVAAKVKSLKCLKDANTLSGMVTGG